MPKPATTAIEKTLVQAGMEILQDDYCRAHGERPSAALLAEELYERRESSAVTRHIKHGKALAYGALVEIKRLSLDAAIVLGDWQATLSPRTSLSELRGVLARALFRLGSPSQVIALLTTRDIPELPDAYRGSFAEHPISRFVVEAVLLRRCQHAASVHIAMTQAWRTGVSLVQNCMARPYLNAAAHAVWESALQFAPSHVDVLRFGEIDGCGRPQVRPWSTGLVERSFQYHTLVKFVPATLAGEKPVLWDRFPSDVTEFLQWAAFIRDCDRVSKLVAKNPASAEDWRALLCRQHSIFQNKHVLFRKFSKVGTPYLPAGLPKIFH
jgi:hypothetical protein